MLRHQLDALRPGGTLLLVEFDIGAMRGEPEVPLVEDVRTWIEAAFRSAGADPRIGAHAGQLLRRAGLTDVRTFGIQSYLGPDDPTGPILCAGITRSLAPQIVARGHRGRGGARSRHAAGARRGAGRCARRRGHAAGGRRRLGHPPRLTGGAARRAGGSGAVAVQKPVPMMGLVVAPLIAGRSLWKECVGMAPVERRSFLETTGRRRFAELVALLDG